MGEILVLPGGSASTTSAAASATSVSPNGNITLTANVADAATGAAKPTGLVQFELNGLNIGNPVALVNGKAVLTTPINGVVGTSNLTAFYQGDATYTESLSAAIPITISTFALSSPGITAPLGSAAIAPINVDVATNYTAPIAFTCTMPSTLTESACFVNPNSMTGTGQASLTVNTTPSHPLSSSRPKTPGWLATSGGTTFACLLLLALPRRRTRVHTTLTFLMTAALSAALFMAIGCSGSAGTDPGTAKGTYTVVVTGTSGTGASAIQTTVNVPITIQ